MRVAFHAPLNPPDGATPSGDRLIARGELTELEGENAGRLAVRLTEVANLRGGL